MAHDGLYKALIDGKQGGKGQGLGGIDPTAYAGSLPTSQLHSQGTNTEALNPTTFKQKNATNLEFKIDGEQSKYDLKGLTPGIREFGALPTSQTHSQGVFSMEGQNAVNDRGESIGSLSITKITEQDKGKRPASATNLNFTKSTGHSVLDLETAPVTTAGALPTSQRHSQGVNTEDPNPTTFVQKNATNLKFQQRGIYSKYDLDGKTQPKYSDKIKPGVLDIH